eukprot:scaffold7599_cov19-Tisochrysis_lutea.AAC.3
MPAVECAEAWPGRWRQGYRRCEGRQQAKGGPCPVAPPLCRVAQELQNCRAREEEVYHDQEHAAKDKHRVRGVEGLCDCAAMKALRM